MDSESIGDRLQKIQICVGDNTENARQRTVEEAPKILSSEIHDVFHSFANMLDVHSFMNLAMTSKEMYERCMNNRMIKIYLEENEVFVRIANGVPRFSFYSFDICDNHIEKYIKKLRQLKCSVSLKKIHFQGDRVNINTIMETRRYLKEVGVKNIDSLKMKIYVEFYDCQQISAFIKEFSIKDVAIENGLSADSVRSLLQSNMSSFSYNGPIRGEMLLDVESPIREITLTLTQLSADVYTEILNKIQSGALKKLVLKRFLRTTLDNFANVLSNHDGPLPYDRPLLITGYNRKWFLHRNGRVTACFYWIRSDKFEMFKCKRNDFPAVLKSKERVHKELAEKCVVVHCLRSHFTSFFDGTPVLDASYNGPLPEERPLLCKSRDDSYYLLNEDGSMDHYSWRDEAVSYHHYDLDKDWPDICQHAPLDKIVINKRIEKRFNGRWFHCSDASDFHIQFEDYEKLPHNFKGQLPERRPLVFENTTVSEKMCEEGIEVYNEHRVVLYEDGTLIEYVHDDYYSAVYVNPCPAWYFPSVLVTPKILKEIILDAPPKNFVYTIDLEVFRDAFEGITTLSFRTYGDLPSDRPLVFKNSERYSGAEQCLLLLESGNVRKCQWKDGQATFSWGDPREFPSVLTKILVKDFFEGKEVNTDRGFYIYRGELNQCLADCVLHSYDDSDPHWEYRPLIFEKTEIMHMCRRNSNSGCIDEILNFYTFDANGKVIHITWGVREDRFLSFDKWPNSNYVPPILKTKKILEYLLLLPYNPGRKEAHWYGSIEDYVSYFEGHRMLDFNHGGRLPKTRPLVFKEHTTSVYWFLREDGLLIKCYREYSSTVLTTTPSYRPPALSDRERLLVFP